MPAITGLDTYAVVAAVALDDRMGTEARDRLYGDVEKFINESDYNVAFWYRLNTADLRPAEPG